MPQKRRTLFQAQKLGDLNEPQMPLQFQCQLRSLSNCLANDVLFQEITGAEFLPLDIREQLCNGEKKQFRVADLGNSMIQKIYQKPMRCMELLLRESASNRDSQENEQFSRDAVNLTSHDALWNDVPVFRVTASSLQSQMILGFLSGVLTRKSEAAVVPFNSDYNFFLFAQPCADLFNIMTGEFEVELRAILVRRFSVIFDLDLTLIKARPSLSHNDHQESHEHEFLVSGHKFYCAIREGAQELVQWACSLFKVYIYTNSVFEYALEVCKLIDPRQRTLFKDVNMQNEYELKNIIKSRELFPTTSTNGEFNDSPSRALQKNSLLRQKDFDFFGLNPFETVILDDDSSVWKQTENLLPYDRIVAGGAQNFFQRVREEIWNLFDTLHSKKLKRMIDNFKTEGRRALHDDGCSIIIFNHSLESANSTCSFESSYESNSDISEDDEDEERWTDEQNWCRRFGL